MARTELEQLQWQMSVDIRRLMKQNESAVANVRKSAGQIETRYKALEKIDVGKFMDRTFDRTRLAVFDAGTARIPIFGSALDALGPAGLAAAAGVAALAVATQQTIAAMQFADEIDDAAQKLAIGTDALQEYRFAMTEAGGETTDFDKAMEGFNKTLGAAQSGLSPKAMKGFAALGFTPAQIDSFSSGEEAIGEVARRVASLSKESEQAAVAEKLGLGPMLPLLREGADEMEALRQKAHDLGYVMDADLVKKGADANQEFETMSRVIDVQLKSAFVELSDEVLTFTGYIAGALGKLNDFASAFDGWKARANAAYGDKFVSNIMQGNTGQALQDALESVRTGRTANAMATVSQGGDLYAGMPTRNQLRDFARGPQLDEPREDRLAPSAPRGGGGANRAEREAEQRRQREERFNDQLARIQEEILKSYSRSAMSADEGLLMEIDALDRERVAALKEIVEAQEEYARTNGLKGLSDTEAAQLVVAQTELNQQKKDVIEWQRRDQVAQDQRAAEDAITGLAREGLNLRAAVARTDEDRYAIQLELLRLEQAERRRALERAAEDASASAAERAAAEAGLAALPGMEGNENEALRQGRPAVQAVTDIVGALQSDDDAAQQAAESYAEIDRLRQADLISERDAAAAKAQIDYDLQKKKLSNTEQVLGAIASLQGSSIKELAALGKAAAIAQATIDGILAVQKAWSSAPFPLNLPGVAITAAATAANVAAIAGMADGGWVGGSGGPRQDNQIRALSVGEHVSNARAAAMPGNGAMLDFINGGGSAMAALNAAASASDGLRAARPVANLSFSAPIDARGMDWAGTRRLERIMDDRFRQFESMVRGATDRRDRFRLGRNQDD